MSNQLLRSANLDGEDLLRKHLVGMALEELEAHAEDIRKALTRLMDGVAGSIAPSSIAQAGANRLIKKLIARLGEVLERVDDLRCEMAEAHSPDDIPAKGTGGAGYRTPRP